MDGWTDGWIGRYGEHFNGQSWCQSRYAHPRAKEFFTTSAQLEVHLGPRGHFFMWWSMSCSEKVQIFGFFELFGWLIIKAIKMVDNKSHQPTIVNRWDYFYYLVDGDSSPCVDSSIFYVVYDEG